MPTFDIPAITRRTGALGAGVLLSSAALAALPGAVSAQSTGTPYSCENFALGNPLGLTTPVLLDVAGTIPATVEEGGTVDLTDLQLTVTDPESHYNPTASGYNITATLAPEATVEMGPIDGAGSFETETVLDFTGGSASFPAPGEAGSSFDITVASFDMVIPQPGLPITGDAVCAPDGDTAVIGTVEVIESTTPTTDPTTPPTSDPGGSTPTTDPGGSTPTTSDPGGSGPTTTEPAGSDGPTPTTPAATAVPGEPAFTG